MTPACRFTTLAEADLEEIALHIAADNPVRASSFVGELREHCHAIASHPTAYPLREEYGADIRVTVHGRNLIFHSLRDGFLVIERILHGARHLDWMKV